MNLNVWSQIGGAYTVRENEMLKYDADQSMRHQTFRVNEPKRLESMSRPKRKRLESNSEIQLLKSFRVNEPKRLESHSEGRIQLVDCRMRMLIKV